MSRIFTSDNVTPACAPIMAAIQSANADERFLWGRSAHQQPQVKASEIFEKEVTVFPVATGTAANALALAQLVPPYGAVYCYEAAHIVTDECGAPEFFTGGAKLIGLAAVDGKILPEQIEKAVAFATDMGVHHVKPSAVSLTQATECGTVYDIKHIAAIAATAKRHGLGMHMDGARFANALAHLGCSAADATWRCVDAAALSNT